MKGQSPSSSSKSASSADFETFMMKEIESGRLQTGDRLPTTATLAAQHQLDLRTVQAALSTLAARGVLERKPRKGTFVRGVSQPVQVAFLTGWNLEQEPSYMLRSLVHHLRESLAGRGYRLLVKHDLHSLFTEDDAHFRLGCARLKAELEAEAPAGFIEYQFSLKCLSAIYPEFILPSVTLTASSNGGDIEYDKGHFIAESLRHLREKGCKRVLLIRKGALNDPFNAFDSAFWHHLKLHRFRKGEIREVLTQPRHVNLERAVEQLMLELAAYWSTVPKSQVPDSLIIQDDIMMRGIATALLKAEAARQLPHPLEIVHIANEGIHHHYGIPTTRYELPIRTLACEIARLFDLRLRKQPGRTSRDRPSLIQGHITPSLSIPLLAVETQPFTSF